MSRRRIPFALQSVVGLALTACPLVASAQHHGGQGGSTGVSGPTSRPTGLDEKDNLVGFHHALAVQATAQQIADYRALLRTTEEAKAKVQALTGKPNAAADALTDLDQSVEQARTGTRKFVDGFSEAQKSGLKDLTKKLAKADSDLEAEEKKLGPAAPPQVASLGKALGDFSEQQLALGQEMNITLSDANPVYTLAAIKSSARLGDQTIAVPVTGTITETAADGTQHKLKLEINADLMDLQQSLADLLRPQIGRAENCGERLALRQASIAAAAPASVVTLLLHYERWSCMRMGGGSSATELGEGDGAVEVKLTPQVEKSSLKLSAEFTRIGATGMMGEALRSGDLGDELRRQLSESILTAMKAGANLQILPPAVKSAAAIQSARFQGASAGRLTLVLEGEVDASAAQLSQMTSQLGQTPTAPGTTTR